MPNSFINRLNMDPEAAFRGGMGIIGQGEAAAPAPTPPAPRPDITAAPTEIAEVPDYTDVPTDPGFNLDTLEGGAVSEDAADEIWGHPGGPPAQGPPPVVQPKQLDTTRYGGHDRELGPPTERQADAVTQEGLDAAGEMKRLAGLYGEETARQTSQAAEWEARYQADQAQLQKRMQQIDAAGDAIARHSIDRGRWIKSPSGFLGAIGAAILSMSSTAPADLGVKLINQAIDRDINAQRQEHEYMQADKLGLENNVNLYRQLMGDRQAGDLVHEAKMRQVAAMKVEEIGAQLKSKEAITRSRQLAEELRKQYAQIMMSVSSAAYLPPQLRPGPLADAQTNYGDVTVAPRRTSQEVPAEAGGPPIAPKSRVVPSGVRRTAPSPTSPPSKTSSSGNGAITARTTIFDSISPEGRTDTYGGGRRGESAAAFDRRVGVSGAWKLVERARNREQAIAVAQHPKDPNKRKVFLDERRQKAYSLASEKAKQSQDVVTASSVVSQLKRDHDELKAKFTNQRGEVDYAKIDSVLGNHWKTLVGSGAVDWYRKLAEAGQSADKPVSLSDAQRRAAAAYASKLQQVIVDYGHAKSGGAITPNEMERLAQVISQGRGFHSIDTFLDTRARDLGGQFMNALAGVPIEVKLLYAADKGIRLPSLPTEGR